MIKLKNKLKNIGLAIVSAMFLVCCAGIVLSRCDTDHITTVNAGTTPKYLALGTVYYAARVPPNIGYSRIMQYTANCILKDFFTVKIYSNSYSGESTAPQDKLFSYSYMTIEAEVKQNKSPHDPDFSLAHQSYSLKNNTTGTIVSSGTLSGIGIRTLVSQTLSDGDYTLTYVAGGTGYGLGVGTMIDTFTYNFSLDATPPSYSLMAGDTAISSDRYTNSRITYTASDARFSKLHYRKPGATSYSSTTAASYSVSASTANNGKWYFYASDTAGNTSRVVNVYLDTVAPVGKITANGSTVSSSGYVNTAFFYSATDSGGINYLQYKTPSSSAWQIYSSGKTIAATAANGWYTFRAVDKAGNISSEQSVYLDSAKPTGTLYAGGETIASGTATSAETIRFSAADVGSGVKTVYVKKPNTSTYVSCANGSQYTEEGTYYFYCIDYGDNFSTTYSVTLDRTGPILRCAETPFHSTFGQDFTVRATDFSSLKLYCKKPAENVYNLVSGNSYTVNARDADGKYYFFAEDGLGNRSVFVWIELSVAAPVAQIRKSDVDNSVKITWTDTTATGMLNGKSYTKGTLVKTEGYYKFVLTNESGRSSTYTFTIGHKYSMLYRVDSTCTEQGYTVYECMSCSNTYRGGFTAALDHRYLDTVVEPTCTEPGGIQHVCEVCNEKYTSDETPALGHSYLESVTPPTCTESGKDVYSCQVCNYQYTVDRESATGHSYVSEMTKAATCTESGKRRHSCEYCHDEYESEIPAIGHQYEITDVEQDDGTTKRTYSCTVCGDSYTQDLGNQYEKVTNYVEYLFNQYAPYMWWVLLGTAGVWSIAMGVAIIIAHKNEDKEKAKKMLVNYVIGLVVIAAIVVACPYLVKGIAALVT